jgi:hypothetical protein
MRPHIFLALFLAAAVPAAALDIQWQPHDIPAAMAKAQREGKLLYIFVEGDNCPPCDSFKFSHLGDPVFADFVNTLFVPLRMHDARPEDREILNALRLTHGAVPRFYALTGEGRGVSMSIGTVPAAPMGAVEVLGMATGHPLPVDRNAAAQLANRIRSYANTERAAGRLYPDGTDRDIGVAAVEAWAWALAGRLDEANNAWGQQWLPRLAAAPALLEAHATFWSKWSAPK